jgi:hypothetical protein
VTATNNTTKYMEKKEEFNFTLFHAILKHSETGGAGQSRAEQWHLIQIISYK